MRKDRGASIAPSSADSHGVALEQRSEVNGDRKIRADWNLLVIALGHLVENALRYAPDGSTITLALEGVASGCAIHVMDDGSSVPESELEKILRPFYRVTDAEGYTETAGLGLTIVDLIARRHDGHLKLSLTHPDNEEQPGLTATLVIPWSE